MLETGRYPGRSRVLARDDARDYLYNRAFLPDNRTDQCENPVSLPAIGLPSRFSVEDTPLPLEMAVRCRKCSSCLNHRRRLWTARAVDEIKAARRTWFGTLTVNPSNRFVFQLEADRECLVRRREPLSSLPSDERFRYLARPLLQEATRWLKRVRRSTGVPLRYLLVTESHKSGDPHLHVLMHEPEDPVTKRMLASKWRVGFSQFKLVESDERAAVYVCKYLAKSALTRVRASRRYGQSHLVGSVANDLSLAARTLGDQWKSPNGARANRSDGPDGLSRGEERE
jgi:hypothetical protein